MLLIRHRINTVRDLEAVPGHMGIELDVRESGGRLILQHDPFKPGEDFEDFLKHYRHALLIVNAKVEGAEEKILELLSLRGIRDYFFLDISFPVLVKLAKRGEKNIAVRFSEYEPLEQCLAVSGIVQWVWVDCFKGLPLDDGSYSILKRHFKICIVSPELQSHPKERIAEFKKALAPYEIDAVCTKYPELWAS